MDFVGERTFESPVKVFKDLWEHILPKLEATDDLRERVRRYFEHLKEVDEYLAALEQNEDTAVSTINDLGPIVSSASESLGEAQAYATGVLFFLRGMETMGSYMRSTPKANASTGIGLGDLVSTMETCVSNLDSCEEALRKLDEEAQ